MIPKIKVRTPKATKYFGSLKFETKTMATKNRRICTRDLTISSDLRTLASFPYHNSCFHKWSIDCVLTQGQSLRDSTKGPTGKFLLMVEPRTNVLAFGGLVSRTLHMHQRDEAQESVCQPYKYWDDQRNWSPASGQVKVKTRGA
jgi:hypothetical protein